MKMHDTIEQILGACSPPLTDEGTSELVGVVDALGDALRGQLRDESREVKEPLAEVEARASNVVAGLELSATIVHAEGTSGLLGFLGGVILAAAQAVYHDRVARENLILAMGEKNLAHGREISAANNLTGTTADTIMGLAQLMSSLAFLSLVMTSKSSLPGVGNFNVLDVKDMSVVDHGNVSDMPPDVREMVLKGLSEGKMMISDEARASMEEKGMTEADVMDMLKKSMYQS